MLRLVRIEECRKLVTSRTWSINLSFGLGITASNPTPVTPDYSPAGRAELP